MSFSDYKLDPTGGLYLKTESGKPLAVRLLQDDPLQYAVHGFGPSQTECSGQHCHLCGVLGDDGKPKNKRRKRFKLNIFSHDQNKVMIWEFGPQVMGQLQTTEGTLKLQDVKILDVDLMVQSSGEGMDKEYSVQPMMKSRTVPVGLVLHMLDLPF